MIIGSMTEVKTWNLLKILVMCPLALSTRRRM
jgi:hypothetical protein